MASTFLSRYYTLDSLLDRHFKGIKRHNVRGARYESLPEESKPRQPSLLKAIITAHWRSYFIASFLMFISALCLFINPLFLRLVPFLSIYTALNLLIYDVFSNGDIITVILKLCRCCWRFCIHFKLELLTQLLP